MNNIVIGILIPFIGTALGSFGVFFLKNEIHALVQKALLGFAAGIMVAASVWSLLIPAINMSGAMGRLAFIPAVIGFIFGIALIYGMDRLIPHLHLNSAEAEGSKSSFKKSTLLVMAVTLHNIPEGMAVGVVFAGLLSGESQITMAGAFALTIGIAIQNFPEGAIVSLPMKSAGSSKKRAFTYGILSGIVEPISAFVTILLASIVVPILPYLLSFAAGAMIYVVVEELLPEASAGEHSNINTIGFAIGFLVMMVLDVSMG